MKVALSLLATLPPAWAAVVFLWPPFPGGFGRQAWVPGLLCAAWGCASLALTLLLPVLEIWMALAGVALGVFMARGRLAAWFCKSPLPPGSMSFASGVHALADRSFYLKRFSKFGPVFKTTQFGAPVICVIGMERICQLMRGHAADLGPSPLAFTQSIMGNFLRYMDDETHSRYGGLFRRAMAGEAPATFLQKLRVDSRAMLQDLACAGLASPRPALTKFTRASLDLLLFGFSGDDDRSRKFEHLAARFYSSSIGQALAHSDRRMLEEMESLLLEQLEYPAAEAHPPESVIARIRALDPAMPDRVCLDNFVLMHKIATNNVSSLLLWLLHYWGTQPGIVAQIRSMDEQARPAALDAFLSETLRLSQSEYLYRKVAREFEFEGFRFPRGWMVRSCIWESHRTTEALPTPTEFHLRLGPEDFSRDHFSPFGMGRHACNGVDISNTICRAVLDELAAGFDARIDQAEPLQRQMRHWSHWQPNHKMRVQLEACQ